MLGVLNQKGEENTLCSSVSGGHLNKQKVTTSELLSQQINFFKMCNVNLLLNKINEQ